jgi:hypothetical protein
MLRYLIAYAIGSVVGIVNETYQKPNQRCIDDPNKSCIITLGIANVYGWALSALTVFFDIAIQLKIPTLLILLCVGPLLAVLECAFGKISKAYFGPPQRWKYPDWYCTACDGYISVLSTVYFGLAGVAFWFLLYKPILLHI